MELATISDLEIRRKATQPEPDTVDAHTLSHDGVYRVVVLFAIGISIAATRFYYNKGLIMSYFDTTPHIQIAHRLFDSPTFGFSQLGGVWLPFPHVLMWPFIQIDWLYYNGLGGSIVSMLAYVATIMFLYKIVTGLTGNRTGAVVAAAVFGLNPNVLYMQSVPMTELLLFACTAGLVYYLQLWIQSDDYRPFLYRAVGFSVAGCLTRYEAWVVFAAMLGVVLLVGNRKRYDFAHNAANIFVFAGLGGLGIWGWLFWNQIMFGSWRNWQNGAFADSSLWVGTGEKNVGSWKNSVLTYWYALLDNFGLVVLVVGSVGLLLMLFKPRAFAKGYQLRLDILPTISLLSLIPFFWVALYSGQRPMHVMQISDDLYNVRFGLLLSLPTAIGIGCLVALLSGIPTRVLGARSGAGFVPVTNALLLILVAGWMVVNLSATANPVLAAEPEAWQSKKVLVREPDGWQQSYSRSEMLQVTDFLQTNYDGGLVLASFFGNESVLYDSRINTGVNVYEGSWKMWEPALADPASNQIEWIVMRKGDLSDPVYKSLDGSAALAEYSMVYDQAGYTIYERK